MAGDILYDPLGQGGSPPPRTRSRGRAALVALLGCAAVGAAGWAIHERSKRLDRGAAVAAIEAVKPAAPAVVPQPAASQDVAAPSKGVLSADDINRQSGVKITRPDGTEAGTSTIIQVPAELSVSLQRAPDPRLSEQSKFGLLPKRGRDGSRAAEVYARPVVVDSALPANAPRIALVVGGMGLNAALTATAASELPPAVTLAFAPYGTVLDAQVQSARDIGHEAILQLPMESPGQADPALSHRLLTDADGRDNLDRLHWLMARFTGYVAVANFLGGTFSADAAALTPILSDAADRGLFYFDDGTAARSLASTLGPRLGLSVVRADVVLDASSDPSAIDAALRTLEGRAREHGYAVGFANGLPGAIGPVAAFARRLAGRGIALVPVSALGSSAVPAQAAARP